MKRITLFKSYLEDFSRMEPEVVNISGDGAHAWYDFIDEDYGFNELMNRDESDAWILYLAAHEGGHSWTVYRLIKFIPIYLIMGSVAMITFLVTAESLTWIIWLVVGLLSVIIENRTSMWNEIAAERFVIRLLGSGFHLSMFLESVVKSYGDAIKTRTPIWRYKIMLDDLRELKMEYWRD